MAASCPARSSVPDHLELVGDVSFITVKKAFGFLKKLLQGHAVHAAAYQPNRREGRFSARGIVLPFGR
jgi:hypothetical protein